MIFILVVVPTRSISTSVLEVNRPWLDIQHFSIAPFVILGFPFTIMPSRNPFPYVPALLLLLTSSQVRASDFSFPLTWNGRGNIFRYQPVDTVFFFDGSLEVNTELVNWDGETVDVAFYLGAGFSVGMGRQDGGFVVFDPHDAHYSIIGGLRLEFSGMLVTAEMLHDCFHDIDRYDEVSPIWNVARLGIASRSWLPRYRRESRSQRRGRGWSPGRTARTRAG